MADHALGTEVAVQARPRPTLREEAQILQKAIRYSISTSPEAFLKTVRDVDAMPIDYWEKDIDSSTWVVIQRGEEVVGIAVARPNREIDSGVDPDAARFIESVWIAPQLRRCGMGERLMRFLFEVECKKYPGIRHFLLWVFEGNEKAIELYTRMGFVYTENWQYVDGIGRIELQYSYQLAFDRAVLNDAAVAENQDRRRGDLQRFGVSYRVLGENTA